MTGHGLGSIPRLFSLTNKPNEKMTTELLILAAVTFIGLSMIFGWRTAPGILLGILAILGIFGLFYTLLAA